MVRTIYKKQLPLCECSGHIVLSDFPSIRIYVFVRHTLCFKEFFKNHKSKYYDEIDEIR